MFHHQVMTNFDEHEILEKLRHFLPEQLPLKDFIHHNTLHAFQHEQFHNATRKASEIFGYKVSLSLDNYRKLFEEGSISVDVIQSLLARKYPENISAWENKMLHQVYDTNQQQRIGRLRNVWKSHYHIDLDFKVHPMLFRILCSYLDQGISIRTFPISHKGFYDSVKELEKNSFSSFFKTQRAKSLLLNEDLRLSELLEILVGDEAFYEHYLFDQQFAHPGWSGMVAQLEKNPESLYDRKSIKLGNLIKLELLFEIDALDEKFGPIWAPLSNNTGEIKPDLFDEIQWTEYYEVMALWQEAYEWSYFDDVLNGIRMSSPDLKVGGNRTFQAMFCIDDRECSLRRYLELNDPNCETFGTAGFFGVEFYFQPVNGNFYTKVCPAPVTPKYLIKEIAAETKRASDAHFTKHSHSFWGGWIISQTLGFWSALKLAINIFKPGLSPATSVSFRHMNQHASLTIENSSATHVENGLQIGFTIEEMATRVENLLRSIGLIKHFAPLVYVVGHGSTSINNTHYAGYDCGACSGRPGSVNARVLSFMANHLGVRNVLKSRGIEIPDETSFVGGLHDTSRDEIMFYDLDSLRESHQKLHQQHMGTFLNALDLNAKERSRRFESISTKGSPAKVRAKVLRRSVSLFEPRPELNHATNALAIVGRRSLTRQVFLDRRAFMNSYDYKVDPDGKFLQNILNAVAPVCGGINLEYYFSRVDNHRLGAGTKLAHNVMGLFGVANGTDGDLRTGLPSQMTEVHDPTRLLVVVEHFPDVLNTVIRNNSATYEWFKNAWIHLVCMDPESRKYYKFSNGAFLEYEPCMKDLPVATDLNQLVEKYAASIPVHLLNLKQWN